MKDFLLDKKRRDFNKKAGTAGGGGGDAVVARVKRQQGDKMCRKMSLKLSDVTFSEHVKMGTAALLMLHPYVCGWRRYGAEGAKKCQVCDSGAKIFKVSCRLGGVPRRICIDKAISRRWRVR